MWPDGWTVVPVAGVSVDIAAPPFHAECSWPTKTARDDVTIVVKITDTSVGGGGMLIPRTRINLESSSARQTLERATGLKDDRRDEFSRFFKTLSDLVGELHRQQQPIHQLQVVEPKPVSWLLYDPHLPSPGSFTRAQYRKIGRAGNWKDALSKSGCPHNRPAAPSIRHSRLRARENFQNE